MDIKTKLVKVSLRILPHLLIITTAMIITLCVLDYLNPLMGFLSRKMSKGLIVIWAVMICVWFASKIVGLINKHKERGSVKNN